MKTISVVIPVYNEADSIEPFLARLGHALAPLERKGYRYEFVFVNDGSSDATLDRLLDVLKRDPRLRVIDLSRNFGKEAALTAGLDEASGDAVIPIDVDLQDPPEVIPELVREWERGFDVVLAQRSDRSNDSFFKRGASRWFYKIHNALAEPRIPPDVGDFRLLDRVVVEALRCLPERRRFMKGLFAWVGFRSTTVEYTREPREKGRSKFSAWRLWNLALEALTSFSTIPLRLWSYIGTITAAGALCYMVFIISRTLAFGIDVPGYASLLTVVLFFGGVQLVGIGVLGEYLGRVYLETKHRPAYIIRRRYVGGDADES